MKDISTRNRNLRVYYGLSAPDIDALLELQDSRCGICQKLLTTENVAIDHDHACCPDKRTCGKCVRGILCRSCNVGLGMFLDNPNILKQAIRYLEKGVITYTPIKVVIPIDTADLIYNVETGELSQMRG